MVLVMEDDGSLRPSQSQSSFSRNYRDGVAVGTTSRPLEIIGAEEIAALSTRSSPQIAAPRIPRPEILSAINEAALRYASHSGLRRADLSVTDWLNLFRANIEIESAYDPRAVSSAGAIGLGQLMPGTAKELGVDPHDMRQNLDGSARYLALMLETFGDRRLALATYNAGPDAVIEHNGIPPYRETQNHVVRVLSVFERLEGENS
ncbi:lytic transglycosylase domain-containing protein [uncultured Tateyamaria sp.]|uniref:lytic transglycosylase domain-containing protein n=1 Tax=uncultured Tateyamaria sp. TaxID=455651 RepID=UPI0026129ECB|nr:lytic transglycosylase domain-containing protein [uncultured Tateyamaria sp.]